MRAILFLSVLTHSIAYSILSCGGLASFSSEATLWGIVCMCVLTYLLVFIEPKPVYAQPGQPDVDLPVSPADAPVPSVANDDSILRYLFFFIVILH